MRTAVPANEAQRPIICERFILLPFPGRGVAPVKRKITGCVRIASRFSAKNAHKYARPLHMGKAAPGLGFLAIYVDMYLIFPIFRFLYIGSIW